MRTGGVEQKAQQKCYYFPQSLLRSITSACVRRRDVACCRATPLFPALMPLLPLHGLIQRLEAAAKHETATFLLPFSPSLFLRASPAAIYKLRQQMPSSRGTCVPGRALMQPAAAAAAAAGVSCAVACMGSEREKSAWEREEQECNTNTGKAGMSRRECAPALSLSLSVLQPHMHESHSGHTLGDGERRGERASLRSLLRESAWFASYHSLFAGRPLHSPSDRLTTPPSSLILLLLLSSSSPAPSLDKIPQPLPLSLQVSPSCDHSNVEGIGWCALTRTPLHLLSSR